MENREEYINQMLIKLKVLESRIKDLGSITDEVLHEIEDNYHQQLAELNLKMETAQQKLLKIKESGNSE